MLPTMIYKSLGLFLPISSLGETPSGVVSPGAGKKAFKIIFVFIFRPSPVWDAPLAPAQRPCALVSPLLGCSQVCSWLVPLQHNLCVGSSQPFLGFPAGLLLFLEPSHLKIHFEAPGEGRLCLCVDKALIKQGGKGRLCHWACSLVLELLLSSFLQFFPVEASAPVCCSPIPGGLGLKKGILLMWGSGVNVLLGCAEGPGGLFLSRLPTSKQMRG